MGWLNLRRLTYFRAIIEAGSLSEAARRLSVPQPALSYHLRELEADFGGPLVIRGRNGVEPTEGGQLLFDHATIILAQVERAEMELAGLRRRGAADPRVMRISALPSLATKLTPHLLKLTAETLPLSGLFVIETVTREAREMLRQHEIDFAIVIADEKVPESQWLAAESLLMCFAAGDGDATAGPITFAEALDAPLMLPAKGRPVRNLVETLAGQVGKKPIVIHEIDGPNPRKQATIAGLGKTFLPWISISEEVEKGLIGYREVVDPPLLRHVALEWREDMDPELAWAMHGLLSTLLTSMLR
ncbi:LysR family transcriptional regulator [Paracoccus sp. NGMCC 1.201697]|uniref:LysR family transcriptional regulator n=1 Tax=Paracoccus broussonetiae subsp. drimophilus TaxID=3373869 RepID=A0ABW7LRF3_9RHOB